MITLHHLILLSGIGHLGILGASVQVPRVFDWSHALASLHPFLRRLFWVYSVFIVLVIAGFGVLTLINARALAEGSQIARSLSAFIACFWLARLAVQLFVFDARPFLTNRWRWIGYHTLTGAFVYFATLHGWLAIH